MQVWARSYSCGTTSNNLPSRCVSVISRMFLCHHDGIYMKSRVRFLYRPSRFLLILIANFFHSGANDRHRVMVITNMWFMVITVVWFLKCAWDGLVWNASESDPHLKGTTGFQHPIPKYSRSIIDKVGFLYIIVRAEFDPFTYLLDWRRFHEYDRVAGYMNHPLITELWEYGEVDYL